MSLSALYVLYFFPLHPSLMSLVMSLMDSFIKLRNGSFLLAFCSGICGIYAEKIKKDRRETEEMFRTVMESPGKGLVLTKIWLRPDLAGFGTGERTEETGKGRRSGSLRKVALIYPRRRYSSFTRLRGTRFWTDDIYDDRKTREMSVDFVKLHCFREMSLLGNNSLECTAVGFCRWMKARSVYLASLERTSTVKDRVGCFLMYHITLSFMLHMLGVVFVVSWWNTSVVF